MLDVNSVNGRITEKYSRDRLGLLIKTLRLKGEIGAAQLAERCKISPQKLYQIENNKIFIDDYLLAIIFDELLINSDMFGECDDFIKYSFIEYIDNYLYGLNDENKLIVSKLKNKESELENSVYYYQFLLLQYIDLVLNNQSSVVEDILEKLSVHFSTNEKQLFLVFNAITKGRKNQHLEAVNCLILAEKMSCSDHFLGMVYYHLFINYSQINNQIIAMQYLDYAIEIFTKNYNFIRMTECLSHKAVYLLRIRAFSESICLIKKSIKLAHILNNDRISFVNYKNLSWLYLITNDYDQALIYSRKGMLIKYDLDLKFNEIYA